MSATDIAHTLADIDRRLRGIERASRLPYSSIDGGTLVVTDDAGDTALTVGRQADGSYQITGVGTGQVVATAVEQAALDQIAVELSLAEDMVQEAMLAAGAVTTTKIADDAVTTPKVVAGAIQAAQIAAGAVVAGKIAANAVTAGTIAANAVTASTIAASAVTAGKIAAGAIDGTTITGALFRTDGSNTYAERVEIGAGVLEGSSPAIRWVRTGGTQGSIVGTYTGSRDEMYVFGPQGSARSWLMIAENELKIWADLAPPLGGAAYIFTGTGVTIGGGIDWAGATSVQDEEATQLITASTTYISGSPGCGVVFVVPPSGKVRVHWHAQMQTDTIGAFALSAFQIRDGATIGSGTILVAADETRRLTQRGSAVNTDTQGAGTTCLVTGLTPGQTCNILQLCRVTAGTGTFDHRRIGVDPAL